MATEQLPSAVYTIGQKYALTGWEIMSAKPSFEEDTEVKQNGNGQYKGDITYMRRQTLELELEALAGTTYSTYTAGGSIASGVLTLADGTTATAWKIRSAPLNITKGVVGCSLSLIQLGDMLA